MFFAPVAVVGARRIVRVLERRGLLIADPVDANLELWVEGD
jgi:hypothetical protein